MLILAALLIFSGCFSVVWAISGEHSSYLRWVDFTPSYDAMADALALDISTHTDESDVPVDWVVLLACLGTRYGGDFSSYKKAHLDEICRKLRAGQTAQEVTGSSKYYAYYFEAYSAVLGNFVGYHLEEKPDPDHAGQTILKTEYGLKVFGPIAKNYGYSHYDDFGSSRSYGFRRTHRGNDLIAAVGTPVVAVEGGVVEAAAWNQYGGWRIGIRSHDRKRYYYYAHLRRGHPFAEGLAEGMTVAAGDVIGYVGMTGYSTIEDTNGMTVPHLHFGMQLIFDESQKEGNGEIWIDVYRIVSLLDKNRCLVQKDESGSDYRRVYQLTPLE